MRHRHARRAHTAALASGRTTKKRGWPTKPAARVAKTRFLLPAISASAATTATAATIAAPTTTTAESSSATTAAAARTA